VTGYFLSRQTLRRAFPFLREDERDAVLEQLARQRAAGDFLVFGYVIMVNHMHLLVAPRACGLSAAMHRLKRITAENALRKRRSRGCFWQARYFDFILRRVGDFWDKLDYIHKNPVEAGLVKRPETWPWSSTSHYGGPRTPSESIDPVNFPSDRNAWLYPAPWR
jgi:REP element-mobilizing transposase RayT